MTGPALLLAGFAVTGSPAAGSALLAALTIAAAVGGPLFGVLLDRSPRPDRVLALTLAAYALGVIAIAAAVGRLPWPFVLLIALAAGLFNPAVAGGWTSQLPRIVTGPALSRGFALDAMTYSVASLAGPALAALVAAGLGARTAVIVAAALVALAVPSARSLSRYPPASSAATPAPAGRAAAGPVSAGGRRVRRDRDPPPTAARHRDLRGVLRRDRDAAGQLPRPGRAAAGRPGPRRATDQRDRRRLAGRQLGAGPPPQAARPAPPPAARPAGRPCAGQHAGDRGQHGCGGGSRPAGSRWPRSRWAGRARDLS